VSGREVAGRRAPLAAGEILELGSDRSALEKGIEPPGAGGGPRMPDILSTAMAICVICDLKCFAECAIMPLEWEELA
jgi:hypothetical protein